MAAREPPPATARPVSPVYGKQLARLRHCPAPAALPSVRGVFTLSPLSARRGLRLFAGAALLFTAATAAFASKENPVIGLSLDTLK